MKKVISLVMVVLVATICLTGCKKDKNDDNNLNLVGTRWSASLSNGGSYLSSSLYFMNSSQASFSLNIDGEGATDTFSYTISGSKIRLNVFDDVLIFEKLGDYIYWEIADGAVLKYTQQ